MHIKLFCLLSTSATLVHAILPTVRYNGGCTIVRSELHCYGGTSNRQPTSDHYVLDLNKDFNVKNSFDIWTDAAHADFIAEPNSLFSIVPLNDSFIIHGGLGYGSSTKFLKNITTSYNINSKTWNTINGTNHTIMTPSREGTSILDPLNRIWTWGGISDNTTSPNITSVTYHKEFQLLDLNTMAWSLPENQTTLSQSSHIRPRLEHTATLSPSGDTMVFIGGLEVNESNQIASASMADILVYNITNTTWTMHKSPANSTIPSPRRLHSATQIPNSDLIFVYGGSATDASRAVGDYSYVLNTTSYEWTAINTVNDGAGPRFGHSAALYNGRSLFIVFGADNLGNLRNDFFVLDIVNWQWVADYKVNGAYPTPSMDPTNSAVPSNPIITPTNGNDNSKSSATNVNSQTPIPFNYMKTGYLMAAVMFIFMLL